MWFAVGSQKAAVGWRWQPILPIPKEASVTLAARRAVTASDINALDSDVGG